MNANSELRYIALELTKLAINQKKPFAAVANEFMQNVYELQGLLKSGATSSTTTKRKTGSADYARQKKR